MQKFVGILCALILVFSVVGIASATPFSFNATDTPLLIPPSGTKGWTVSAISVLDVGMILDLNVFVDLNHSFMGDLDIFVEHNGTSVQLFNQHGSLYDDLTDILFDDEATDFIDSGFPPFGPGTFKPTSYPDVGSSNSLSGFDGMDLSGDWSLRIEDRNLLDTGTLFTFKIEGEITTAPVPEPATIMLLGTGLLGLLGTILMSTMGQ